MLVRKLLLRFCTLGGRIFKAKTSIDAQNLNLTFYC